jgi:hypothetical protein
MQSVAARAIDWVLNRLAEATTINKASGVRIRLAHLQRRIITSALYAQTCTKDHSIWLSRRIVAITIGDNVAGAGPNCDLHSRGFSLGLSHSRKSASTECRVALKPVPFWLENGGLISLGFRFRRRRQRMGLWPHWVRLRPEVFWLMPAQLLWLRGRALDRIHLAILTHSNPEAAHEHSGIS